MTEPHSDRQPEDGAAYDVDRAELERAMRQAVRRFDLELDCKQHEVCRVMARMAEAVGVTE